ncbi:uncharacterized protein LOC129732441 [Wyeomyia smithii]|uniref:uncharacterized protein LOC129732441 n=1 Tax=Wyeomyia smithii TaxID=174621 RepID=UPI002467CC4F|nr:uncharacterized protein LOC129732441 [Wyeomyia smithii]
MATINEQKPSSAETTVKYVEVLFNTINHVLIGYVTIYLSYVSYMNGFSNLFTWHIFLCAIGYHFFMAESFLTLYASNSWTSMNSAGTKRHLHWILQAIGFLTIFVGTGLEIYQKEQNKRSHFKSDHAITGLVSMVFIVLSLLNGIASYYSVKIKHIIRPIYIKLCHYLTGIVAFVIGMVSLALEYSARRMASTENKNMLISFTTIVIALTLIGAVKTMYGQLKGFCR